MDSLTLASMTNISSDENYIQLDKLYFDKLHMVIFDSIYRIISNIELKKNDKIDILNKIINNYLVKMEITNIEKKLIHNMFNIIIKSLITISDKKFKPKYNINNSDEIIENIEEYIKNYITHKNYGIKKISLNFFNIILLILNKTYNYNKIDDRKNISLIIVNNLIKYLYNYYNYNELEKIEFFNKLSPIYIDTVLKLCKNNNHNLIFKSINKSI